MKKIKNIRKKHTGNVGHHEKTPKPLNYRHRHLGKASQDNGIDQIFNKITEENMPQTKERHTHTDTRTENTK